MKKTLIVIFSALLCAVSFSRDRESIDLSGAGWNITLDEKAVWENDELFLPPVDVSSLPVNVPTGGWSLLANPQVRGVSLPATVEEYLWGWNGATFGVGGNYVGVSWFETEVFVPDDWEGRRVSLDFEAVRFRAEVFVNRKLVGYDIVNSTPFGVDVTDCLVYGGKNLISVRITDPNGNFNWKDSQVYSWGKYRTNPSHGFGGISGKVCLTAVPQMYIKDIYVQNQPDPRRVKIEVSAFAPVGRETPVIVEIYDNGGKKVLSRSYGERLEAGDNAFSYDIRLPKAKLWSPDEPNLYKAVVCLGEDALSRRFGFRWFEVKDNKGDMQFFLNGKRIVLRTSISWSFWPENGLMPSDELARKQIEDAKALGLNMLNFHRSIGQSNVLEWADSLGLLYWEEPGGNQYPASRFDDDEPADRFYFGYRNEKLRRMILRDRSHPSLIIYNMHNERGAAPQRQDYEQMAMGHRLDPSRILLYNSCNGKNPEAVPDAHFKTHLMPFDTTFRNVGWWDNHHAGGPGVYHDALYNSPEDYLRGSTNRSEIVVWGEEGAIGTPPRLQLIRDAILKSGKLRSWEAQDYLDWYAAYDNFLKSKGFGGAFPDVDSLTRAMGAVSYYYQGRIIENIRINNTVDAYAINGWESMKLENHSGVVDNYRNLKADPSLIASYNRPVVLSVKLREKVFGTGNDAVADIYLINEENLHGQYVLDVWLESDGGEKVYADSRTVRVSGGDVYGELLAEGISFRVDSPGYSSVKARLVRKGKTVCEGEDRIFSLALSAEGIPEGGLVADSGTKLTDFLASAGVSVGKYEGGTPDGEWVLVGDFEPQQWGSGMSELLEWVYKGHSLVIVGRPERWAEFLADKEVLDYRGSKTLGTAWYGGNFFNRAHPVWDGLPSDCAFNWEYQCFAKYNRRRIGLRCENGEILAAAVADHKKEVYSVLDILPAGRGRIILTTLDIPACVESDTVSKSDSSRLEGDMNDGMFEADGTYASGAADVIGRQLLLNMLKLCKLD